MRTFLILFFSFISFIVFSQKNEKKIIINGNWTKTGTTWNAAFSGELIINFDKEIVGQLKWTYINCDEQSKKYYDEYIFIDENNKLSQVQRKKANAIEFVNGSIDNQLTAIEMKGIKKQDLANIIGLDEYKIILKNDGTFKGNALGNEKKWLGIIEGKYTILDAENGSFDNFTSNSNLHLNSKQNILRSEKWMLLNKNNPIFTFNFDENKINVLNSNNQLLILKKSSEQSFFGEENNNNNEFVSYNSFFLEETYQQERGSVYSFSYVTPYKMKMHLQQNWKNFLGYSDKKQDYVLIKDLKVENEKSISDLEKLGIVYRTEFKNGKIGDDYVPEITSIYNAGKTYNVGGVSIQEEDYRTKVDDGGYTNAINGYTAIYQLINKSTKNYLINYTINGTSKMTDIVINKKWFSYDKYNTQVTYNDFDYTKTIILKPNESLKDQLIVGTEIPINYALLINEVKEVSNDWLLNLNNGISGTNISKAKEFLNDNLAKKYYNKKISENIINVNSKQIQVFTDNNKKFITITIKPKDETLFDKDFQSDVETKIVNNSMSKLKVKYDTPFGIEEVIVESKKNTILTNSIKGIDKVNLKAKILTIEKID